MMRFRGDIRPKMCWKAKVRPRPVDMNELTIKGGQFGLEAAVERLAHGFLLFVAL